VVAGRPAAEAAGGAGESSAGDVIDAARVRVEALVRDGVARPEAARLVAAETGLSRRTLYRKG
jgi:hypothetical protein